VGAGRIGPLAGCQQMNRSCSGSLGRGSLTMGNRDFASDGGRPRDYQRLQQRTFVENLPSRGPSYRHPTTINPSRWNP
jgi:hypothetical protein